MVKIENKPNTCIQMFVRVQPDDLVIRTKYKITVFPYNIEFDRYSGVFKETMIFPNYTYLKFEKLYDLIQKERCSGDTVVLNQHKYYYYAFISDQPQWKMERRAVSIILRRLIGDECFTW